MMLLGASETDQKDPCHLMKVLCEVMRQAILVKDHQFIDLLLWTVNNIAASNGTDVKIKVWHLGAMIPQMLSESLHMGNVPKCFLTNYAWFSKIWADILLLVLSQQDLTGVDQLVLVQGQQLAAMVRVLVAPFSCDGNHEEDLAMIM